FQISGDQPASILMDVVDVISFEDGRKQVLPVGTTPNSIGNAIRLGTYATRYVPDGTEQIFSVSFALINPEEIDRFVIGGIRINIIPDVQMDSTLNGTNAAVATFVYNDAKQADFENYLKALEVSSLQVTKIRNHSLLDAMLPDVPGAFGDGNVQVSWTTQNTGEVFLSVNQIVKIRPASMFGRASSDESAIFVSTSDQSILIPKQSQTHSVNAVNAVVGSQRTVAAIEDWGFYEIEITAIGQIDGREYVIETRRDTIVIFPWEYVAAASIGLIVYLARRRWKIAKGP
ncbi:MAG: hypothetical protein RIS75_1162, partial [Actinomycetota bacterium]